MRRRWSRITAIVPLSSAIGRRPCVIFGLPIVTVLRVWMMVCTTRSRALRTQQHQPTPLQREFKSLLALFVVLPCGHELGMK